MSKPVMVRLEPEDHALLRQTQTVLRERNRMGGVNGDGSAYYPATITAIVRRGIRLMAEEIGVSIDVP